MKNTISWLTIAIIVIIGGWLLLSSSSTPKEEGPIKIGFIGPLTGDAAVYGEPFRNVIQLATDEINNSGGVIDREVKIIYEDGKCTGKDAAGAMQKLVNIDKVKVVIGGFCSGESLSAVPIAEENKVLLFSAGSSSPDLTGISRYFFRNYPGDDTQGKVLAEVAYNDKNWGKVATIQEQTDYAIGVYKAFKKNFIAFGGEVVVETFPPETVDFRTQLTKLKAENPDALLVSVQTPQVAELILKQLNELNWRVNLLGADVIPGSDLPSTQPELVEGMIVAEFGYDESSDMFTKFVESYNAFYNKDPEFLSYAQTAYDALYIIKDAINAVGRVNVEEMITWLENLEGWKGVSGELSFKDDHDPTVGHKPEVIIGGKVIPYKPKTE